MELCHLSPIPLYLYFFFCPPPYLSLFCHPTCLSLVYPPPYLSLSFLWALFMDVRAKIIIKLVSTDFVCFTSTLRVLWSLLVEYPIYFTTKSNHFLTKWKGSRQNGFFSLLHHSRHRRRRLPPLHPSYYHYHRCCCFPAYRLYPLLFINEILADSRIVAFCPGEMRVCVRIYEKIVEKRVGGSMVLKCSSSFVNKMIHEVFLAKLSTDNQTRCFDSPQKQMTVPSGSGAGWIPQPFHKHTPLRLIYRKIFLQTVCSSCTCVSQLFAGRMCRGCMFSNCVN